MNILYCRTILSIYPKLKKRITTLENLAFKRAMAEFYSRGNLNKGGITAPFDDVIRIKHESGLLQYLYEQTTLAFRSTLSQDELDAIAYWYSPDKPYLTNSRSIPSKLQGYSSNYPQKIITRLANKVASFLSHYIPDTDFEELYLPLPFISDAYAYAEHKAYKLRNNP